MSISGVNNQQPTINYDQVIRRIVIALLLASAVIVGFVLDVGDSKLAKFSGINSLRALRFLSRLLLLSAPVAAIVGITLGNLGLRSSKLAIDIINLLRIAQWAPFLIAWTLAFALTLEPGQRPGWLTWLWLSTYCAVAVGLRVTYEYLLVRYFDDIGGKGAIKQIMRPAITQGLFIALLLDMFVLARLWNPFLGMGVGYSVSIVLAAVTLLLNWVAGETFQSTALKWGRSAVKAFEKENFASLVGPSLIVLLCFFLWLVTTPFLFTISPSTIFDSLSALLGTHEFYNDVSVSSRELVGGMLISGSLAGIVIFLRQRFSIASRASDPLLQASQLAPIALLPNLQILSGLFTSQWSVLCVATFTFYPFLSAFTGYSRVGAAPRIALATSEALPYACAAFVLGETWNATAGLGFMMTVAAATYDVNKGMAGFVVLMLLFAAMHITLHCLAKTMWSKNAQAVPRSETEIV